MSSRIKRYSVFWSIYSENRLFNLYNCLEMFHTELDFVVLANIQAFTSTEETGEKR